MNTYTVIATVFATLYVSYCANWLWGKVKRKKTARSIAPTPPAVRKDPNKKTAKQIAIKKSAIALTQDDQVFVLNLDPLTLNTITMTMQEEDFVIEIQDGDVLEEINPDFDEPVHLTPAPAVGPNENMLAALQNIADEEKTIL
jgi:hypothetical protein